MPNAFRRKRLVEHDLSSGLENRVHCGGWIYQGNSYRFVTGREFDDGSQNSCRLLHLVVYNDGIVAVLGNVGQGFFGLAEMVQVDFEVLENAGKNPRGIFVVTEENTAQHNCADATNSKGWQQVTEVPRDSQFVSKESGLMWPQRRTSGKCMG
jgi:hypothetical protein